MHLAWLQIPQRSVQSDVVVLIDESRNDSLRLQVVVSVVIIAVLAHCSVKSLDDSVRFWMPRPRADVEQIVRFDDGTQLAVAELTAVIVDDARLGSATLAERRFQLGGNGPARQLKEEPVVNHITTVPVDKRQQEVVPTADPCVQVSRPGHFSPSPSQNRT